MGADYQDVRMGTDEAGERFAFGARPEQLLGTYCMVVGFLFSPARDNGHVVLIQKDHPEWQAGMFNGVGGKVKPGETWSDAMRREFFEEAGVDVETFEWYATLSGTYETPFEKNGQRYHAWMVRFYRAFDMLAYRAGTREREQIVRIDVRKLGEYNTIPNLRWLVPLAVDESLRMPMHFREYAQTVGPRGGL